MLGHHGISELSISEVASATNTTASLPFVTGAVLSYSAPTSKPQLGYAHVAQNLLLTTLAVVAASVLPTPTWANRAKNVSPIGTAQQQHNLLESTLGVVTSPAPFVQQLPSSAPEAKKQVFVDQYLNYDTLGIVGQIPLGQRSDAGFVASKANAAVYQFVNELPLLSQQPAPFGLQQSVSATTAKFAVSTDQATNRLPVGIPPAIPIGRQVSDSFAGPKQFASTHTHANLLSTTLLGVAAQPIGAQVFAGAPPPKYNVRSSLFPGRVAQPDAAVPTPVGSQRFESAPPPKYNVRSSLFPERIEQPTAPVSAPVGGQLFSSAPATKFSIRVDVYPNTLAIGLPNGDAPASVVFGSNADRLYQPLVDQYPNLLATTLAVQVQAQPIGKQSFESFPKIKYQTQVDALRTNLVIGPPTVTAPVGSIYDASATPQKPAVYAQQYVNNVLLGIPIILPPQLPLGLPVDTNQAKLKFSIAAPDVYPNTVLAGIPPPVVIDTGLPGGPWGHPAAGRPMSADIGYRKAKKKKHEPVGIETEEISPPATRDLLPPPKPVVVSDVLSSSQLAELQALKKQLTLTQAEIDKAVAIARTDEEAIAILLMLIA